LSLIRIGSRQAECALGRPSKTLNATLRTCEQPMRRPKFAAFTFAIGATILVAIGFYFAISPSNEQYYPPSSSALRPDFNSKPEHTPRKASRKSSPAKGEAWTSSLDEREIAGVPFSVAPEQALRDAILIVECTDLAESSLPAELNDDQRAQMKESQLTRVNCDQLNNNYSIYQLAKYAAERGNTQAQLDFSALASTEFDTEEKRLDPDRIREFKADSQRYLIEAAASGSTEALSRLAASYANGLFSEKDSVKAYAYASAYYRVSNSAGAQRWAQQLSSDLTADQVRQGDELAEKIARTP